MMQLDELPTGCSASTQAQPTSGPAETAAIPDNSPPFIDPLELEALALILEHSLRVHTSHHFFSWTQGLLQNLIRHEMLICALRKSESPAFHVDSFTSSAAEPALVNNLFSQDTTLVPHLLKLWEANHFQPVLFDMSRDAIAANSNLGRELARAGIAEILVHGTHDTFGRPVSVFLFASLPGSLESRHCRLAALLVPSLHAAWVHTQFTRLAPLGQNREPTGSSDLLTVREQEILGWIYRGKSNIEIGMILGISPLTVKNHVQKILRRLNVLNRAQAVGKALALRILDCSVR